MNPATDLRRLTSVLALTGTVTAAGCADAESRAGQTPSDEPLAMVESTDYCALPAHPIDVLQLRPGRDEPPIDDVNWFARPLKHEGEDRVVAFASHNQNYLYNLTRGVRVKIPDRSDAVATPDGRYMTVPSSYTPDANIRFYPMEPLLAALSSGDDADQTEPAFIHEHPSMKGVYYQSTGVIEESTTDAGHVVDYRLMFSGGHDESNFRIVDYRFTHDPSTGDLTSVRPSAPMALCPAVRNDLNTPFISKDARYVAAYTSDTAASGYSAGASLKIFEITSTDPASGTTTCEEVVDFGFAAGKADFAFDGESLTFHISQGGYLTPFINGGLPSTTITDVVVAQLEVDVDGRIVGSGGLQRLTTSVAAGVGSYFPAFFSDGAVFYVANAVPRESEAEKRFHFRVVDPEASAWRPDVFADPGHRAAWGLIEALWERSCRVDDDALADPPFPLKEHEAPWLGLSLSESQCRALVDDSRASADPADPTEWGRLREVCSSLGS